MTNLPNNIADVFPSNFLKAVDLPDEGNRVLTIESVEFEPVGLDKKMSLCLHFQEITKSLVLNKTNAGVMADLFGADPHNWAGKKIALYQKPVEYAGKTVMGVRINPKPVQLRKSTMQTVMPPEPEFPEDEVYEDSAVF